METNKITALYCRLSREDERVDGSSSIETQKQFLKRYANEQNLSNINYYIDDGYSGTNFERPAFQQLEKDIDNKLIKNIIVKDLSRLGRNYLTTGYYIEHYFPINSVRFIAVNDQVDTNHQQNDLMPFRNIMNEWYARDISQKIRTAYKTKAINGEFTGPMAPYGYAKDPEKKNHLVVEAEQAKVVREIFSLYIGGLTISRIIKHLRENRVLTPRGLINKETGKYNLPFTKKYPYEWSYKSIQAILSNEEYTGNLVCNRHSTVSYKNKKLKLNPEEEWIITKNNHEVIISEDTYQKAIAVMRSRYRKKLTINIHLFMGIIRCGECGRTLTFSIDKRRNNRGVYVCSTYRTHGKARCTGHYIRYDKICRGIYDFVKTIITMVKNNEGKFFDNLSTLKQAEMELNNDNSNLEEELNGRLYIIRKTFTQMYEDHALRKIPCDEYNRLIEQYELEKQDIKNRLDGISKKSLKIDQLNMNIRGFVSILHHMDIDFELTKEIVDLLIEKIVITESKDKSRLKTICIHFKNVGIIPLCCIADTLLQ